MWKIIKRGYRTELDPNLQQRLLLQRHAGTARFVYNWGLEKVWEAYLAGRKPSSAMELQKELNRLKKTDFPWMYEVSSCAPQQALWDLEEAYDRFLRNRKGLAERIKARRKKLRKDRMPHGFPRFKSRKGGIGSFRFSGGIRVFRNAIQLPRMGRIRLKEKDYLPTEGVHILSATVSKHAGRWLVSLQVDQGIEVAENHGPVVGVDLGIHQLIAVSDGTVIENPRALKGHQRKLSRLQRPAARKRPNSQNWAKLNQKIARCHYRITNIRRDTIHKATTWLARAKSAIGVEALRIEGMMGNHHLAGSIADAGWGTAIRQLEYKTAWYGSRLVKAKSDFPSTRRCSRCGWVNPELPLSQRVFRCEHCGLTTNRDLNAARNIELVALSCRETLNARQSREVTAPALLRAVPGGEAGTESGHIRPDFGQRQKAFNHLYQCGLCWKEGCP